MAQKTRAQILAKINAIITTNANEEITGALLNDLMQDIKDSHTNLIDDVLLFGMREFSESRNYRFEEGVIKSGKIYQCTNVLGHAAGIWDDANFTAIAGNTQGINKISPDSTVPVDTEYTITLPQTTILGCIPRVIINGISLTTADTTVSGAEGFSHVAGTNTVKIRVPYTIATDDLITIYFEY